ncbi:polysaccharide pyruvyl transferase family protein [Gottfriedia sp. NPDC057948]|uniref:polysaccharide pyruvyl transferase family protein n=1 Tax=Gottfriedia sp. NPDC057948 TaxID=3346287 RepID=UPI0036DE5C1A
MKKILVDVYCNKNFGDDLFLKILFERYEHVDFYLQNADYQYKNIIKDSNILNNNKMKRLIFKLFQPFIISKFDGYILIGGSMFMQNSLWKKVFYTRSSLIKSFVNKNKKVYILGSNFGPFSDQNFLKSYTNLFSKFSDVCFRDMYSFTLFKNLRNVRVAPDIVFNLKAPKVTKIKNSVGFSLIDLENRHGLEQYSSDYEYKMVELVKKLIDSDKQITFFSFCEEEGDVKVINKILSQLNKEYSKKIKIINYNGQIDYFLEELGKMESFIGARFHSIILAKIFNQSFYPLIYSDKTFNVLKDLEESDKCTYIRDIASLDTNELIKHLNEKTILNQHVKVEAEAQFKMLDKFLNNENKNNVSNNYKVMNK